MTLKYLASALVLLAATAGQAAEIKASFTGAVVDPGSFDLPPGFEIDGFLTYDAAAEPVQSPLALGDGSQAVDYSFQGVSTPSGMTRFAAGLVQGDMIARNLDVHVIDNINGNVPEQIVFSGTGYAFGVHKAEDMATMSLTLVTAAGKTDVLGSTLPEGFDLSAFAGAYGSLTFINRPDSKPLTFQVTAMSPIPEASSAMTYSAGLLLMAGLFGYRRKPQ